MLCNLTVEFTQKFLMKLLKLKIIKNLELTSTVWVSETIFSWIQSFYKNLKSKAFTTIKRCPINFIKTPFTTKTLFSPHFPVHYFDLLPNALLAHALQFSNKTIVLSPVSCLANRSGIPNSKHSRFHVWLVCY